VAHKVVFVQTVLDAQAYTVDCIEFLIKKARLYRRLQGQLNKRQQKVNL
jgi:hypothetical protein